MSTISSHKLDGPRNVLTFPASFSQQRLWFLQQWNTEQIPAITTVFLRIDGPIHPEALEQSLNDIVHRHDILRTTFAFLDGQLTQQIVSHLTLTLSICDLQHLPEEEWASETQREARRMAFPPFDLAQGPLMRVALVRLAEEKHLLILVAHQIIFDAQSTTVFLQELAASYQAHRTHRPAFVPTLPMQYADFALQQQEWVHQDTFAPHLAYWKHTLQHAPAALDLPTDHPHPLTLTNRGDVYPFVLSKKLMHALNALSRQEQVSLSVPLLAAFAALLGRSSGQEDLCIGTPSVGRSWPHTTSLIGNFVNTLVVRADLSGNPTFLDLVARVHDMITATSPHAEVPFEHVLKELHLERQAAQNSFFQVFFALEPSPPTLPSGWSLLPIHVGTGSAQCDLSLILTEYPEGLHGYVEYRTDLFEAASIERLVGHWLTLLEAAVMHPTQPLRMLPIVTERERLQLVEEWNATQAPYPQNISLHQCFEEQVARTPDALAISYADQSLTYEQLNVHANRLAYALREKGVGPDVLVGIFVERSLEMVIGVLGILKAGGAYVPLDPAYPSERLAFLLEDAQVPVLVTQAHLMSHLPTHPANILCLDADSTLLQQQPTTNPPSLSLSSHLAYVIYTSGSTGRPKGVQICHRSVVNFLTSMRQQPGLSAEDRLLAVTTLSFDIAALELYLPLITGAQVIIASTAMASDGTALAQVLTQERITVMQATPITWHILLASGWQGSPQLRIFCGGEALPLDLAQQLLPKAASLWNLYGPTETTIWSTAREIKSQDERISIGHPIANTEVYLLDTHLQLVPIGVPGELYIGGDGLARGYLHRPELTQERFIAHPFRDDTTARLYRTGDLAYYQPDGTIVVLGRLDHQVKVRGFRIELGEIETVISQHPSVQQAVVVVREETPGDARLVAYVVPHVQQHVTSEELHQQVQKHLPTYMLPYAFVLMETLPLTPNGKIDRRALPTPEVNRREEESTFVAPQTALQRQLVTLWEELLQVHPIGIHDNFFDVGGHSLLAMRLIEQIEQVYGKKLALSTLFSEATIEQIALALQQNEPDEAQQKTRTPLFAVQTGGAKRPFFFLHGQWEGGALYSLELARVLGSEQPFYLLDPYRFADLEIPPTIEEMAAAHLNTLRQIQPEGPYQFGGWCNGGLIAYEMARQLHAQGQTVDLLVLMDADAPAFRFRRERLLIDRLMTLLRLSPEQGVDWFLLYRHLRLSFHEWRLKPRGQKMPMPDDQTENHEQEAEALETESSSQALFPGRKALRQEWLSVYEWAVAGYLPSAYPGEVTFFWTQEEPARKNKWLPWITGKEPLMHLIPGNHITSRTLYLPVLAEQLRKCIQAE